MPEIKILIAQTDGKITVFPISYDQWAYGRDFAMRLLAGKIEEGLRDAAEEEDLFNWKNQRMVGER